LKNGKKNFKKTIDKQTKLWYNKDTKERKEMTKMKILFIIYLITVALGALGEFFMSARIKETLKNGNYEKVRKSSFLIRFANILKLCVMALIPLYNIVLFFAGLTYTEEMCIKCIENSKAYVKKDE
jgi:uncharacterized protein involved in response to NO